MARHHTLRPATRYSSPLTLIRRQQQPQSLLQYAGGYKRESAERRPDQTQNRLPQEDVFFHPVRGVDNLQ